MIKKKILTTVKVRKTLFLDRDGVINIRILNDYVCSPNEFVFCPNAREALRMLAPLFDYIFVVTNQQGVGLSRMSEHDLEEVHQYMMQEIGKAGGRIDQIYSCTDLQSKPDNCRKPGTKMAEQALNDFPDIKFSYAIMVGDTESDMLFGRTMGMCCVYIGSEPIETTTDYRFDSLYDFALYLST